MWTPSEEKKQKKFMKIGRNGALAFGCGLGLWLMKLFYPQHEGAEKIADLFGETGLILLVYGAIVVAALILKREAAPAVNFFMSWIIVPAWLLYLLVTASGS